MKKSILLFFISTTLFFSCKKDKDKPNGQVLIYSSITAYAWGGITEGSNPLGLMVYSKTAPDCYAEGFPVLTKPAGTYTITLMQAGKADRTFQVTVESGKCKSYDIYSYFK